MVPRHMTDRTKLYGKISLQIDFEIDVGPDWEPMKLVEMDAGLDWNHGVG